MYSLKLQLAIKFYITYMFLCLMFDKLSGVGSRKKPFLRDNIQENDLKLHYQLWQSNILHYILLLVQKKNHASFKLWKKDTKGKAVYLPSSWIIKYLHSTEWSPYGPTGTEKFLSLREQQIYIGALCRHVFRLPGVQSLVWTSQVLTGFPTWPWSYSVSPDWEATKVNFGWQRTTLPQQC